MYVISIQEICKNCEESNCSNKCSLKKSLKKFNDSILHEYITRMEQEGQNVEAFIEDLLTQEGLSPL